jgi:hypothetical protein
MALEDSRRSALDRVAVCDVADFEFAPELLRECSQPVLAPCEQDAVPVAAREEAGSLGADAGGRACDDGYA